MSTFCFGISLVSFRLCSCIQAAINLVSSLAKWGMFALFFALVSGMCSTAFGQRVVPSSYAKSLLYFDQLNKQDAAQKNVIIGEAKTLINQSTRTIEQCEKGLTKVRTDLSFAAGTVQNCEKLLEESESALRGARRQRADQEERILAGQDETSSYVLALKNRQAADDLCVKNVECVLKHPVKDGSPQKLSCILTKSEFKKLEEDKECVAAFRQYDQAKTKLAQELKRIVLADMTIAKLDETIQKLTETQKKQKADLSVARTMQNKLKVEARRYSATMEMANTDLQSAQLVISQITGK